MKIEQGPANIQKSLDDEKTNFFENFYNKFNENEQYAVHIMSALSAVQKEVRKEAPDKDKIYDMIETIEAHLGSMLNTEQDGMPSKAFRESEKKGGSLKSMGRIAELYD